MHEMTSGPELQLRRIAMGVDQGAVDRAAKRYQGWASRIEGKAKVKPTLADEYLAALATFGAIPTVRVEAA